jgi:hypothetical protein
MKASVNRVIEDFNALVPDEQVFVVDIFQKILAESKCDALSRRAKKAVANFKARKVNKGTPRALYKDLEND